MLNQFMCQPVSNREHEKLSSVCQILEEVLELFWCDLPVLGSFVLQEKLEPSLFVFLVLSIKEFKNWLRKKLGFNFIRNLKGKWEVRQAVNLCYSLEERNREGEDSKSCLTEFFMEVPQASTWQEEVASVKGKWLKVSEKTYLGSIL